MKNIRKQLFICVLLLVTTILSSCNLKIFGDKNHKGDDNTSSSEFDYQVVASTSYEGEKFFDILYAMDSFSNVEAQFVPDSSANRRRYCCYCTQLRIVSRIPAISKTP